MRRNRRVTALGLTATAAMVAALVIPSGAATAKPGDDGSPKVSKGRSGDVKNVGPDYNQGKKVPFDKKSLAKFKAQVQQQNARQANGDHEVGDQLRWLALNDNTGQIYFKTYTMRGLGDHIQVWVADDRAFPAGDCRNDPGAHGRHRRPGEQLHRRVRRQHLPEGVAVVLDAPGPRRVRVAARRRPGRSRPPRPMTSPCWSTTSGTRTTSTRPRRTARPTSLASSSRSSTTSSTAT